MRNKDPFDPIILTPLEIELFTTLVLGMVTAYPQLNEIEYSLEKEGTKVHFQISMNVPRELQGKEREYKVDFSELQGRVEAKRTTLTTWDLKWHPPITRAKEASVRFLLKHAKTDNCVDAKIIIIPVEHPSTVQGKDRQRKEDVIEVQEDYPTHISTSIPISYTE